MCKEKVIVSGIENFPGELDTLRTDNLRLRRLLQLSEEQARAAASDQATLTGAPDSPVTMGSSSASKVRFFFELFRCRTDIYALRWENRRDGRSGWMPAIKGYWRKGMNRADAPYLPLTPEVIDAHLRGETHVGLTAAIYPFGVLVGGEEQYQRSCNTGSLEVTSVLCGSPTGSRGRGFWSATSEFIG